MRSHAPEGTQYCPECGREIEMVYPAHFNKYLTCGVHRFESDNGWISTRIEDNPFTDSAKGTKKDEKILKLLEESEKRFGVSYISFRKKNEIYEVYGWNGFLGEIDPRII